MAEGKYTTRTFAMEGPYVNFLVTTWGTARAELGCYRTKRNGGVEELTVTFNDLSVNELLCIARGARRALRDKVSYERNKLEGAMKAVGLE